MTTDPTTPEGRAELRQLLEDGKRDHWEVCTDGRTIGEDAGDDMAKWIGEAEPCAADLIIAAVNALPALLDALDGRERLAEVSRTRELNAEARAEKAEGELEAEIENRDSWEERLTSTIYSLATVEEVGEWTDSDDLDQQFIDHIGGRLQSAEKAEATLDAVREYAQKLRNDADVYQRFDVIGTAALLRTIAATLERKIGDRT